MAPEKKQILFIEGSPSDSPAKFARALQKAGYETILLSLTKDSVNTFLKGSYDRILDFQGTFFRLNLRSLPKILMHGIRTFPALVKTFLAVHRLKPYLVIARSTPNWLCFLALKYFAKVPCIYFPWDFRSFVYQDVVHARKEGVPSFELKAERYCFEHADGIMYKGVENKLDYLNEAVLGKNLKIQAPLFHFVPYCSQDLLIPPSKEKLSKKDGEIHIVFTGHIGIEPSWIRTVKQVIDQNIHLHLYGKTIGLTSTESEKRKEYAQLLNHPYFHLHKQLPQEQLIPEIAKYDYGIWLGYFDSNSKSIHLDTGNKFATYLEAGLPIIYYTNHEYIGRSIQTYGAGLGITIDTNLPALIKKQNYAQLVKKIERGREKAVAEKQVPAIEQFFQRVLRYWKSRQH